MAKRKKRTITPEHLAKMQAGRKAAQTRKKQEKTLHEYGFDRLVQPTKTERMIANARPRRKGRT